MTNKIAIGIDVGGTGIKAAAVDGSATIVARGVEPLDRSSSPDAAIEKMALLAEKMIAQAGVERTTVAGVGVGMPGPLDRRAGRIICCANLPAWEDVPLCDLLARRLDLPVVLDNDGNAAAYGEYWRGLPERTDDLVMLTLGTGVGGGAIVAGRVYHGHFQNASELGHMIVEAEGLPCPCGQRGCLEQYASASAVARLAGAELHGGQPDILDSLAIDGGSLDLDAARVVELAKRGNAICKKVWDNACRCLAIACVNIQHTFNPARIALGGGMSQAGEFLIENVRRHLRRHQWQLSPGIPDVSIAKLGNDAGVVGAAGLAIQAAGDPSLVG